MYEAFAVACLPLTVVGLAVVYRMEKRILWPYGEPEPAPQYQDTTRRAAQRVRDAVAAGFTLYGWCTDRRQSFYRCCYAILVSPERDCLMIVGAGQLLASAVCTTWIYSFSTDGRGLYTTDASEGIELDLTRQWKSQLCTTRNFDRLLQRHRDAIVALGFVLDPLAAGQELEDYHRIREEHFGSLARKGLIEFTDEARTNWHYTLWGGLKMVLIGVPLLISRMVTFGRFPRFA